MANSKAYILATPPELKSRIFYFQPSKYIARCRRVCKELRNFIDFDNDKAAKKTCRKQQKRVTEWVNHNVHYLDEPGWVEVVDRWVSTKQIWSHPRGNQDTIRMLVKHAIPPALDGDQPPKEHYTALGCLLWTITELHLQHHQPDAGVRRHGGANVDEFIANATFQGQAIEIISNEELAEIFQEIVHTPGGRLTGQVRSMKDRPRSNVPRWPVTALKGIKINRAGIFGRKQFARAFGCRCCRAVRPSRIGSGRNRLGSW